MQNRKATLGGISPLIAYGSVFGIVASCTLLNSAISPWLSLTDLAMVYLLGVVIAATYLPWHASVTSAVLSLFCFDFFLVPPVFTFQFADKQNLLTGLILLAVGVITSALASEMRRQTKAAAEAAMIAREEQLRSSLLASISHDLRTPLAVIAGSASTLFGTRVTMLVQRTQNGVQVAVEDDGPGLPSELRERLFEKFERGQPEGETAGSGLGLAICRAIARLHGMEISADNRPEGGARFAVSITHVRAIESAPGSTHSYPS